MDRTCQTLRRGQRNFLCPENKTSLREGSTLKVLLSALNQLESMFRNQTRRKPKITIPTACTLDYRSESVMERLGRIAVHYEQLEGILAELEAKLPAESAETVVPKTIVENLPSKPR